MIAAGTESMTAMPQIMGNKVSMNPAIFEHQENIGMAFGMGLTGEKVAERWKVSREDQDAFALASHQKACAAIAAGHFRAEITPFETVSRQPGDASGTVRVTRRVVEVDEGPRPDSSAEALARLKPVFAARGSVTAGNSSQMSDGAAAVILVQHAEHRGLCQSVVQWYRRAFPSARTVTTRRGERIVRRTADQVGVVRCAQGRVRLGIGPDVATARALVQPA